NRGAWRRVGDGLQFINTIQKEFLNDAWLGLRPANWIGNALGGTVNTFAIDAYTFKPLGGMIDHLNRQLGGYPATPSMFGIETGKQLGRTAGQEFSGSLIGRLGGLLPGRAGRTIQGFMKGVYGIPYGATELKLPGGVAIPIGEEAFRTRAFYVPFQRVFRGEWRNSVDGQLVPKLMQAAGLSPEQAKMVGDLVYTLGENGGKLDIMSGLRKWVGKPQLKPTLQSLGIPPELLSPSAVRD